MIALEPISASDARRRDRYVASVKAGVYEAGLALRALRDERLYRSTHTTFELFCQDEFGIGRHYANRAIAASEVIGNLVPMGTTPTERQARELVPLEPEAQRVVWELATSTAPDGKVTAEHVRALAAIAQSVLAAGAIDEGSGEMVAWDDLPPERQRALLQANLAEETYERLQRQKAHVSHNTGDHEWYTPAPFIEAARKTLGKIDLDPASCATANTVVKATRFYAFEDDGLDQTWAGRVWMNPPFASSLIGKFVDRLVSSYMAGGVTAAIVLVNNATETAWCQQLMTPASALCFPAGRVKFWHPEKQMAAPLQGQMLAYLGKSPASFHARFADLGIVVVKP